MLRIIYKFPTEMRSEDMKKLIEEVEDTAQYNESVNEIDIFVIDHHNNTGFYPKEGKSSSKSFTILTVKEKIGKNNIRPWL